MQPAPTRSGCPAADLDLLNPLESLQVSRNGQVVVYAQRDAAGRARVWRWDGQRPVSLTTDVSCQRPTLDPDGRWLAFVRTAGPGSHVMIRSVNKADDRLVLRLDQVRDLAWSPTGKRLAVVGTPPPSHPASLVLSCTDGPWNELGGDSVPAPLAGPELWVCDLDGSCRRWPHVGLVFRRAVWLNDEWLLAVATEPADPGTERLVRLGEHHAPVPWSDFQGHIGDVAVSPSGRLAAWVGSPAGSPTDLAAPGLYRAILTSDGNPVHTEAANLWERPAGTVFLNDMEPHHSRRLAFLSDDTLLAVVGVEGRSEVYRWAPGRPDLERLPGLPVGVADLAASDTGLWVVATSAVDPPELFHWTERSGEARPLTRLHSAWLARHTPIPPESFTVDGGRFRVSGWRWVPSGPAPHPTVLLAHRGPGHAFGGSFHAGAQFLASHGYLVLAVNPRGSAGYGHQFTQAVMGDVGGGDFQDLMAVLDDHAAGGLADPERLAVMGWRYGGFLAAWAITQTDRFRAAVMVHPLIDWFAAYGEDTVSLPIERLMGGSPWDHPDLYLERTPLTHAAHVRTPSLLLAPSRSDAHADAFYAALRRLGVPAARLTCDPVTDGERLTPQAWQRVLEWLDHWL
jgi:dipeptidyl aminopeptidase/acylaminoacyl peptidase